MKINKTTFSRTDEFDSKAISSTTYNFNKKTLTINFTNGNIYKYKDVEEKKYADLVFSASLGKHFHDKIKNNYEFVKIVEIEK